MAVDQYELQRQQMHEQAAANERARAENVQVFTRLFLGLGPDCQKLAGSSHDQELLEARGLASHRWNQLLNQEAQIVREEQALAARPKKRPAEPKDELLPDRTLDQRNKDWEQQTESMREQLKLLKQQAEDERRRLGAYVVDFKKAR